MIFPSGVVWKGDPLNKTIYLTFDDGPEPGVTPFVLNQLAAYNLKGTFFCIGDNVRKHPETFEAVKAAGHRVGNHTMHHPNGWLTNDKKYVAEVYEANKYIQSDLFRPPYGKITYRQARALSKGDPTNGREPFRIIMWSVIAGDFDEKIDGDVCFRHVKRYTGAGSLIVFHDSLKAFPRLKIALPKTLEWLAANGYQAGVL